MPTTSEETASGDQLLIHDMTTGIERSERFSERQKFDIRSATYQLLQEGHFPADIRAALDELARDPAEVRAVFPHIRRTVEALRALRTAPGDDRFNPQSDDDTFDFERRGQWGETRQLRILVRQRGSESVVVAVKEFNRNASGRTQPTGRGLLFTLDELAQVLTHLGRVASFADPHRVAKAPEWRPVGKAKHLANLNEPPGQPRPKRQPRPGRVIGQLDVAGPYQKPERRRR